MTQLGEGPQSDMLSQVNGHQGSVKCLEKIDDEGKILASGGRDGKLIIYDMRKKGVA